jgi:hypothetical protein
MLKRGRHFGYSKRVFGIGYAVPHWGQVMVGSRTKPLTNISGAGASGPILRCKRNGARLHQSTGTEAIRRQIVSGTRLRSVNTLNQAAALDQAHREQERETWEQFKQRKDDEVHQLVDQNAPFADAARFVQ